MNEDLSALRGGWPDAPVKNGIPRFVDSENYATDFGSQWKAFPKTQLDSHIGIPISEDRLARCMHGELASLAGKRVLEAGSGAGRFTEILLKHGAQLCSFDFSAAVEANALNNGDSDRLTLVQADIRNIPFEKNAFDYVICLGVLQHTPSPEQSIACLYEMVKPGGRLVIDHYIAKWRNSIPTPFGGAEPIYRKWMLNLPKASRMKAVKRVVDFWFPIHWHFRDSQISQRILRRLSPVHFYYPHLPLNSKSLYYEWALLDTHDATTDFYKHHRSVKSIERYLLSLGATDVAVTTGGNGLEAYCVKPATIA